MGAVSARWALNGKPEMAEFIRKHYVVAAVDIRTFYERKDSEGEFFRAFRASYDKKYHDQGFYVVDTAGKCYVGRIPLTVKDLTAAFERFEPVQVPIKAEPIDQQRWAEAPPGSILLRVISRTQDGKGAWRSDTARDTMWISKEEAAELAKGHLPLKVGKRLIRFHLLDFFTGSPFPWAADDVKQFDVQLNKGVLRGSFCVERKVADEHAPTSSQGRLFGHVENKDDKLTRFDIVVLTRRQDKHGSNVQGVAFTITNPMEDEPAKLMPGVFQGGRGIARRQDYLNPQ